MTGPGTGDRAEGRPAGLAAVAAALTASAGRCRHCGQSIRESHLRERIAREAGLGTERRVTVLVHARTGHERCEGRDTLAEREGGGGAATHG